MIRSTSRESSIRFSVAIASKDSNLSWIMLDLIRVLILFSAENDLSAVVERKGTATAMEYTLLRVGYAYINL